MADSADSSFSAKKRPRRDCHFDRKWNKEFQGITSSSKGKFLTDHIMWTTCYR